MGADGFFEARFRAQHQQKQSDPAGAAHWYGVASDISRRVKSASPAAGAHKLHSLQVLRFIAALAVVIAHSVSAGAVIFAGPPPLRPDFFGAVGVGIFFTISGFIMVYTTRSQFGRPGAARSFLVKRFDRVVPIYWVVTLVALAVVVLGSGHKTSCNLVSPGYLAASLLFIAQPRCDGTMQPLLTQGWTLNYEVFFYIAFALSLLVRRWLGLLLLCGAFLGLVVVGLFLSPADQPLTNIAAFYTDQVMVLFVAGIVIALAHEWNAASLVIPVGGLALAVLAVAALAVIGYTVPYSSDPGHSHILVFLVALVVVPLFVFCRPPPGTTLLSAVLERLGDASYSLYLTHNLAISLTRKIWSAYHLPSSWSAFLLTALLLALVQGLLVYRFLELPLVGVVRALRSRTGNLSRQVSLKSAG